MCNANVTSHVEIRKTTLHGKGYSLDQATAGNPSFWPCKTNIHTYDHVASTHNNRTIYSFRRAFRQRRPARKTIVRGRTLTIRGRQFHICSQRPFSVFRRTDNEHDTARTAITGKLEGKKMSLHNRRKWHRRRQETKIMAAAACPCCCGPSGAGGGRLTNIPPTVVARSVVIGRSVRPTQTSGRAPAIGPGFAADADGFAGKTRRSVVIGHSHRALTPPPPRHAQRRRYHCPGPGPLAALGGWPHGCRSEQQQRLVPVPAVRYRACVRAQRTKARATHTEKARAFWPPCITEYFDQWPQAVSWFPASFRARRAYRACFVRGASSIGYFSAADAVVVIVCRPSERWFFFFFEKLFIKPWCRGVGDTDDAT